ncbi:type II toxin-antitoxin system RelE/ParE family toxin [Streptomyces sp. NPDC001142]
MADGERYAIEIEPEVRLWLEGIPARQYVFVEQKVDRLAANATTLGEPYTRHLGGKLRELRFDLDGNAQRITYWIAPGRRVVLLTVFRKTRMRESTEVERAQVALSICEARHEPAAEHSAYSRDIKEDQS